MSLSNTLALLLIFLGAATQSVASIHPVPLNGTVSAWPPEPFRFPLPDYRDGYLVLHHYGPSGSAQDRTTLLTLLEMVTRANSIAPPGYPSPNVDLNFPDTGVFLRIRGTAAPGFPSLSTKLALSASASFKSLVGRYGAKEMFVSVHDGYLDYGPWGIMIKVSQSLVNLTDRQ